MKTLSICIPTYNKIAELTELVDGLLKLERSDFEIVITDNVSTDGTRERFQSYPDQRVRYCRNDRALPPFMNMIHSIFNASGKYALYCNDRDLIIAENIPDLIDVLAAGEYAFVYGPAYSRKPSKMLQVYEMGFDSLVNQVFIDHPSGMIYNRELIAKYLREEDYEQYLPYINTYSFLMLDILQYGKSAKYDGGYWKNCSVEYISKHKSGTINTDVSMLYFVPQMRERMFYRIAEHMIMENNYRMSSDQKCIVVNELYRVFVKLISRYKACMSNPYETAHYGLTPVRIPTMQIMKIFSAFFARSIQWMNEKHFDAAIIQAAEKQRPQYLKKVLMSCMKINIYNLIRKIR